MGETTIRAIVTLQQDLRTGPAVPVTDTVPASEETAIPWGQHTPRGESFEEMVAGLPARARRALEMLKVENTDQLVSLDPERVCLLRGMGETTIRAIVTLQQDLRAGPAVPVTDTVPASEETAIPWGTLFREESATQLPLFIGGYAEPSQLHESYSGDALVSELRLPSRVSAALEGRGIRTVGQLVGTSCHLLLGTDNFGSVSLKATQDAVLVFLHQRNGLVAIEEPLELSSFEQIRDAVLTRCIVEERPCEVLRRRIGLDSGQPVTLEQIAQEFGLTRERIRQIEQSAIQSLRTSPCRRLLAPFLNATGSYFNECGGIASHDEFAVAMMERLQWPKVPAPKTVSSLLAACDADYALNINFIQKEHRCRKCHRARAVIEHLTLRQERVSFREARDALRVNCGGLCDGHENAAMRPSDAFLRELVEPGDDGAIRLFVADGVISASSGREPSLPRKCELVVVGAKGPIHYLDVWKAVTTQEGRPLPQMRIHCYLTGNRSLLLWDRGIFVHPDYVTYDAARVQRLARTIARKLQNGMPFLSVYGIYQEFKEDVTAAGLPNDHALYSVLRRQASDELACDRYPYVRLCNSRTKHWGAAEFVENLVGEADGPIRVEEVRRKLCEDLGVRPSHCNQAIAQAGGVCNTGDGYLIHFDQIDIRPQAIEPIIQHALTLLNRCEHTSVARIFQDKRATCASLGIRTPRLLYELLDRLAGGRLAARTYPQIRLPEDESDNTIREDVAAFVREKDRAVSVEEIREVFTTTRGYRPATIHQASTSGPLHPYYPGCVIHAETLGLVPEHGRRLLEEARRFYETATSRTECWATIDAFLELREGELPRLSNGASWTDLLAHSLLFTQPGIHFVGNSRLAYVCTPNPYGVENLDDLCAIVVADVFGGGCSIEQLTDCLVAGQVIRKRLTPAMLTTDQIVIDGDQVCLKELVTPCSPS